MAKNSAGVLPIGWLLLSGLLAGTATNLASATGVIVSSAGFEAPAFTTTADSSDGTGGITGQQGWLRSNFAFEGGSNAIITNEDDLVGIPPGDGSQVLQVDRVGLSDRRWAKPVSGFPTGRFISISWDMAVTVTQNPGILGPFFGVEAYDDDGVFGLFGSLGVDGATGEVLLQEQDSGFLIAAGPVVASNEWNHFEMQLDFQTNEYSIFLNGDRVNVPVDGSSMPSMGFVDRGPGPEYDNLNQLTDADIATFAGGADFQSQSEPGRAVFDNFIVIDGIPGDYDGSGTVDLADYTVWRDNLGQTGIASVADASGDGVVGIEDYEIWQANFGQSNTIASTITSAASIPEPSSLLVLCLGASFLTLCRSISKAK